MTQVLEDTVPMDQRFCTHCNCAVGLHDEIGCGCSDSEGHLLTLSIVDQDKFCSCERTREEFDKYGGWSKSWSDPGRDHPFGKDGHSPT